MCMFKHFQCFLHVSDTFRENNYINKLVIMSTKIVVLVRTAIHFGGNLCSHLLNLNLI